MGKKGNWIQGAIKPANKGAFSKKAEQAGKSTAAYAKQVLKPGSTADATTQRQANLAQTLGKLRKRKGGK